MRERCDPVTEHRRSFREWNIGGTVRSASGRPGRDPVREIVSSFHGSCLRAGFIPSSATARYAMKRPSSAGKAGSRRGKSAPKGRPSPDIVIHHPDAAGIDVGSGEFVVAVPADRCDQPVRTFTTFTSGVEAVCTWLLECGIATAAMESTGNYWITLYDTLTRAGIEVYLVNARHVKGVPGKKTDVCDARWLQQLHASGLLRKSFRPAPDIVPLRFLMRHRGELTAACTQQLQLMQKSLTEMNLKPHHVFSDIDGISAQAIIGAILAGERDPARLAALRDRRCRSSVEDIMEALRGDYREEYLFVLRQSVETWKHLRKAIASCDEKLGELAAAVECEVAAGPPPKELQTYRLSKNNPSFGVLETAWRFYGVDLSGVPGISAGVLSALISEVGTGGQLLKAFRSAEAFASWMGLCPDNRISGGKVLKAATRKVKSRLAQALRLGVFGLQQSTSRLGQYVRRMKGKLGKAEGLTAGAHKLARIIYGMIKSRRAWDEKEAFKITPQSELRRRKSLERQAAELGLTLRPAA